MADPYYANVSLLLPMNGANNGTVFTDYSPTPKTVTRYGDTKTVTFQSKYYGSSGYFDGTGDYLALGATHLTANSWCSELWVRFTTLGAGNRTLFSQYLVSSSARTILDVRNAKLSIFNGAGGLVSGATTLVVDTWYHVAFVRIGTNCRAYLNGVLDVTHTNFSTPYATATWLGSYSGASGDLLIGHCQDVRITDNEPRYTADFTPPPRLLPGISGTILDTTGTPCARQIYVYNQASGALLASTTSDASTGYYEAFVHPTTEEVFRVVVANEPTLYNNLIDRIIPA